MSSAARLLIVEHEARRRVGHYMKELEALATELRADGHEIHVLSAGPLAIEAEGRSLEGVTVHEERRVFERAETLGQRVRKAAEHRPVVMGLPLLILSRLIEQPAVVAGIVSLERRLGDIPVLVTSRRLRFEWAVLFAPRSARWTVYTQERPYMPKGLVRTSLIRARSRLLRRREMARRRRDGWVQLVANNPVAGAAWKRVQPWVDVGVEPLAGTTEVTPSPRETARRTLGLDSDDEIALVFGRPHRGKDTRTLLLAFAGDDAPARLVVAGAGAQREMDSVLRDHPTLAFPRVTLFEGPQSDERKRLFHSAADFVVLSFNPAQPTDSGTLTDAMNYGLPVCCSDPSASAVLVAEGSLGLLFSAGDPDSLRAVAAKMSHFHLDPVDRERFMRIRSQKTIARRLLDIALSPPND